MQNYSGYGGFNPYLPQYQNQPNYQNFQQNRVAGLKIIPVSNVMEANATPVNDLEPIFFYNRAENVIYKKQIDSTGAAPIQTFKLELAETTQEVKNPYEQDFKEIRESLNELKALIKPFEKEGKR